MFRILLQIASCWVLVFDLAGTGFAQSICQLTVPVVLWRTSSERTIPPGVGSSFFVKTRDEWLKGSMLDRRPSARHVIVLLDGSTDTNGIGTAPLLWATQVVKELAPSDEIALRIYGVPDARPLQLTRDRQSLIARINEAGAPTGTERAEEAVSAALDQPSLLNREDALIVIGNLSPEKALADRLVQRRVRLFVLSLDWVGQGAIGGPREPGTPTEYIQYTGGMAVLPFRIVNVSSNSFVSPWPIHLTASQLERISSAVRGMVDALDNPIMVRFAWPQQLAKETQTRLRIEVRDRANRNLKGVRLFYPRSVRQCD